MTSLSDIARPIWRNTFSISLIIAIGLSSASQKSGTSGGPVWRQSFKLGAADLAFVDAP